MITVGTIENAICTRLQTAAASGILGYRFKIVAPYGGEFDNEAALKTALNTLPAAYPILVDERQVEERGRGRWLMEGVFAVFFAAQNKRNSYAARHGAAGDVGVYQMAQDARRLLSEQTLGLGADISPLVPLRLKPFPVVRIGGDQVSVLVAEFSTRYLVEAAADLPEADFPAASGDIAEAMADGAGITDFNQFNATWEPPHSSDGTPAMGDNVTLEGQ